MPDVFGLSNTEIISAIRPLVTELLDVFSGDRLSVSRATLPVFCAHALNGFPHHFVESRFRKAIGHLVFVLVAAIRSSLLPRTPGVSIPQLPILHKLGIENGRLIRQQRLVLGDVRFDDQSIIRVAKGNCGSVMLVERLDRFE